MSNIKVAVRVRPLNKKEKESSHILLDVHGETISIENAKLFGLPDIGDSRERIKHFTFDHCYNSACDPDDPDYASQELIFQDLGTEVLQSAFRGYNVCVFAYGQTGTGKTYTMMGCPGEIGLIPRICEGLFSHVDNCAGGKVTCRVDVSYYEIYNERVRDLLQAELHRANEKYTLKVREHPKQGPYVQDLSEHRVKDNQEIQSLLDRGNEFRTTAATYMHDHSSRSHAIVTINFTQAQLEENMPSEIVSKIHLVDLAGSERADPHFSTNFRERLKEGANINKSLVTLGYVIKALAERSLLSWSSNNMGSMQNFHISGGGETMASPELGHRKQHVPYIPYRDSVLTWLLKDSLGGNSKTIMIATITPSSLYYSETINTLRYAQRAKIIVNKPHVNEDPNVSLIRQLRQEIDRLHTLLASAQEQAALANDIFYLVPFSKKTASLDSSDGSEQAGSFVSIHETGSQIAEKLQENEVMANQLTKSWMTKWTETHDLIRESDMSIRGLGNRSSSMGVLIDSQLPYLIGMGDDILSTGVHMYHLKEGKTVIGNEGSDKEPDIVLTGPNILNEHCIIEHRDGTVTLYPLTGAQCAVQGIEVQEPTRLTQGDIIILGGTQIFRFNNPSEAAKLREYRQSQSNLALDALSRTSSFSSIGGDDSGRTYLSPHSQMMRFYPNYAAPDMCLNFEQKYQTEPERIEDARRELERLIAQIRQLEDARQEKEEEMWVSHDQHKQEIEEQKQHLAHLIKENQSAREKAEEELKEARENLKREQEAYFKQIQAEMEKLRRLEKQEHRELAVQTEAHQCTTSTSFDMEVEVFSDNVDAATDPSASSHVRKKYVADRMKELQQEELKIKLSDREMEICLAEQQEDIEDDFLQKEEQLRMKIRKLEEMEEEYKRLGVSQLKEISNQHEELQELQKQSAMLEVYIEEKQDLINVGSHVPRPLRSARSEMFLTDPDLIESKFSLKELQCGSEGDLAIASSVNFSVPYSLESMDSVLSQSMDSSITSQSIESLIMSPNSDSLDKSSELSKDSMEKGAKPKRPLAKNSIKKGARQKNTVDRGSEQNGTKSRKRLKMDYMEKNATPKIPPDKNLKSVSSTDGAQKTDDSMRLTYVAKDVISRLYQPPPPKFKYVPKMKEDNKREPKSKFQQDSPKKLSSHRESPSQDSPRVVSQKGTPSKESPQRSSLQKPKSKEDSPHLLKAGKTSYISSSRDQSKSGGITQHQKKSQESNDFKKEPNISEPQCTTQSEDLTSGLTVESPRRVSGRSRAPILPRMTSSKLVHFPSASSLASVPEAINEAGEEIDMLNQSFRSESAALVIKRRNKGRRKNKEDEFRRHSEPVGEKLADALEHYKREIEQGLDLHRELRAMKGISEISSDETKNESMSPVVDDSSNDIEIAAFVSDNVSGKPTESSSLISLPQIIVTDESDDSSTVENVPETSKYRMETQQQATIEQASICGKASLTNAESHNTDEGEITDLTLGDLGFDHMGQIPVDGQHESWTSSAMSPKYMGPFIQDRTLRGQNLLAQEMDTQLHHSVSKPGSKREHYETKLGEPLSFPTKISKTDTSNFSQPFLFVMDDFSPNLPISYNVEARSDLKSLDYQSKQNMKQKEAMFNAKSDSDEEMFSDDSLDEYGKKKKDQREAEYGDGNLYDSLDESAGESDSLEDETASNDGVLKVASGISAIDNEVVTEYKINIQLDHIKFAVEHEHESQDDEFRSVEGGYAVQWDIPQVTNKPAVVNISAEPDISYSSHENNSKEFTHPVYRSISVEKDNIKSHDGSTTDGKISIQSLNKDFSRLPLSEESKLDIIDLGSKSEETKYELVSLDSIEHVSDNSNRLFLSSDEISKTKMASAIQSMIVPNAVAEKTLDELPEATNTFTENTNSEVGRQYGSYEEKNTNLVLPGSGDSCHDYEPDSATMSELTVRGNQADLTTSSAQSLDTICHAESFGSNFVDDASEADIQVFTLETDGHREVLEKGISQEQSVLETKVASSEISSELGAEETYQGSDTQTPNSVTTTVIIASDHNGDTDKKEAIAVDFESGSLPVSIVEVPAPRAEYSEYFDSPTSIEDTIAYQHYELTHDSGLASGTNFVSSHSSEADESPQTIEREQIIAMNLTERNIQVEPVQNVIRSSADKNSSSTEEAFVIQPEDNEQTSILFSESYKNESETIDVKTDIIGLAPYLSENEDVQTQNMETLSLLPDVGLHRSNMDGSAEHITGCDNLGMVSQIFTHKGDDHVQSMQEDAGGSTSVSTDADPNKPLNENSLAYIPPLSCIGNDLVSLPTETAQDKSINENKMDPSMPAMKLVAPVTNIDITIDQQEDHTSSGTPRQDNNICNMVREGDSNQRGFKQTPVGEGSNAAECLSNLEIVPCLSEDQVMEVIYISLASGVAKGNDLPSVDTRSQQKEHNADKRQGVSQATDGYMETSLDELRPVDKDGMEGFSDDSVGRMQKSFYDGYLSDSRVQGRPDIPSFEKLQAMDRHRSLLDSGFIDHYDSPSQDTDTDSPEHTTSAQFGAQNINMKEGVQGANFNGQENQKESAEENLQVSDHRAPGTELNGGGSSMVRSTPTAEIPDVSEKDVSKTGSLKPNADTVDFDHTDEMTSHDRFSQGDIEQIGEKTTIYSPAERNIHGAEMKEDASEEDIFSQATDNDLTDRDQLQDTSYQHNTILNSFDHPNSEISMYALFQRDPNAEDLDLTGIVITETSHPDVLMENNHSEREMSLDKSSHTAAQALECNTNRNIGLPMDRAENVDNYQHENNCTVTNNIIPVEEPMETNDQPVLDAISSQNLGDIYPDVDTHEETMHRTPFTEQKESLENTPDQNLVSQQLYSFEGTVPTSGAAEEIPEDLQVNKADMDFVPMLETESLEPLQPSQSLLIPPETRSLGVGTGQDLLDIKVAGDVGEDGHSQCSNDSLLDPHEELQVLQEELESLLQKTSATGPQLSTARRAARQRAMIRQQQLTLDSNLAGQLSDDYITRECKSKSSSRPGSGSKRRRRPQNKTSESFPRRLKSHSSEEYASSENDSVYSDNSLHEVSLLPKGQSQNSLADKKAHYLATQLSEFTNGDLDNNMNSEYKVSGWKDQRESGHEREDDGANHGKRSMAVQTEDSFQQLLSPGSTQTGPSEDMSIGFYSDQYGANRYFVMSPLSVWSSNEQSESDSPSERKRSSSSGGGVRHVKNIRMTPTPTSDLTSERKASNLDKGPTEVWSTSSFDLRTRSFRGENSYILETEGMSPSIGGSDLDEARSHRSIHSPITTHGQNVSMDQVFISDSDRILYTSTPSQQVSPATNMEIAASQIRETAPIKFEVTVHENETNIVYNVEKTDYRTYPLRSGSETSDVFFPDTIHVNLRESVSSERDERHHSYRSERINFRKETDDEYDDSITFERTYNAPYSAQRDTSQANDKFFRDETKEEKSSTENYDVSHEFGASDYSSKEQRYAYEVQKHSGMDREISLQKEILMASDSVQPCSGNSHIQTELDNTSDYGTITSVDGRIGLLSFTSDSDDGDLLSPSNISPRSSHSHSKIEELMNDVDAVNYQRRSYLPLHGHHLEIQMQEAVEIKPEGQNLFSDDVISPVLVAGQLDTSSLVQFVSQPSTQWLKSQDQHLMKDNNHDFDPIIARPISVGLGSLDVTGQQSSADSQETIDAAETEILLQQLPQQLIANLPGEISNDNGQTEIPQDESKLTDFESMKTPETSELITKKGSSIESADERYFSQEWLDCTGSESSEYRTPQQSPRSTSQESLQREESAELDMEIVLDIQLDVASIKDVEKNPNATPREVTPPQPKFSKSLPQRSATVRTVSVNTDAPTAFTRIDVSGIRILDPSAVERRRKELEREIAHLQRHVRSLSDSAISSDYTDGDSTSLSPRPSRFCETDQSFRFPVHNDVGLIQARTYYMTQSPIRAFDFEGSAVSKMPFNDSGNVYDDSVDSGGHPIFPGAVGSSELETKRQFYGANNFKFSEHSSLDKPESNATIQGMASGTDEPTTWLTRSSIPERCFTPVRHEVGKFPERLTDALLALKPYPVQRSASLDSLSALMKMGPSLSRALRSSKSIEQIGDDSESRNVGEIDINTLDVAKDSNISGHERADNFGATATTENKQEKNVVVDDNQNVMYKLRSEESSEEEELYQQNEDGIPPYVDAGIGSMNIPLLHLDSSSSRHSEQRSLSPGEIGLGPESLEDMLKTIESEDFDIQAVGADGYKDLYLCRRMHESFSSLTDIVDNISSNYQRSLSEGCVSYYDQHNFSGSSDDSITFVFVTKSEKEDLQFLHDKKGEVDMIRLVEDGSEKNESPFSGSSPAPGAEDGEIMLTLTDTSSFSSQMEEFRCSEEEQMDDNDNDQGSHKFAVDNKPLKHRYGIDESVLPMPERSVSCDNLPKHVSKHENIHRSRSTSMLNLGVVEDPKANEGIFPPTLDNVDEDSQLHATRTMSDRGLDQGYLRTRTPEIGMEQFSIGISSEMETESSIKQDSAERIHSPANVQGLSSSDNEIFEEITIKFSKPDNATQNLLPEMYNPSMAKAGSTERNVAAVKEILRTVKEFIVPKLTLIDRGMSTDDESSRFVSVGVQASLTGTATQTDVIIPGTNENILLAHTAAHQSHSHESDDLGHCLSHQIISENSANWLNLGEIMQDTKRLLQRINESHPETSLSTPSSQSNDSLTHIQQLQDVSVQTGGSLTNLQSIGLQTYDEVTMFTFESESQSESTQTDPHIQMRSLEQSETVVNDLLPGTTETIACEICIQTDEENKAINVIETMEISIQTDEVRPSIENEDEPPTGTRLIDLLPSGTDASRIAHYLFTETKCNDKHESETSSDVSYMRQTVVSVPLKKDLEEKKSLLPENDKMDTDKVDAPTVTLAEKSVEELPSTDLHRQIYLNDHENASLPADNELTAEQVSGKPDSANKNRFFGLDDLLLEHSKMMALLPHGRKERQIEEEMVSSIMSKKREAPQQTTTRPFPSENDMQPGLSRNISEATEEPQPSIMADKFTQVMVTRDIDKEDMVKISIQVNDPVSEKEEKQKDEARLVTETFVMEDISDSDTGKEHPGIPTSDRGIITDVKVSPSLAVVLTKRDEVQEMDSSSPYNLCAPSFYIMPNMQQQQEQHEKDSSIKDGSKNGFPRSRSHSKASSSSENTAASAEVAEFMEGHSDNPPDIFERSGAYNSIMLQDDVEDVVDDVLSDASTPRGSGNCSPVYLYENNYQEKDVPCTYRETAEGETQMGDRYNAGPVYLRVSGGPTVSESTQEIAHVKLLQFTKSVLDEFAPPSPSKRLIVRQIDEETILPQMNQEMQSNSKSSCLNNMKHAEGYTEEGKTLVQETAEEKDDPEKHRPKQQLPCCSEIHQGDDARPQVEETVTQQKPKARNLGPNLTDPSIRIQESYPEWRTVATHEQYRPEEQPKIPSSSQSTDDTYRSPVTENTVTTHRAQRRNLSPRFTEHSVLMPTTYHEKKHVASGINTAADAMNGSSQSQGSSQAKLMQCPKSVLNEFVPPSLAKRLIKRQIQEEIILPEKNKGRQTDSKSSCLSKMKPAEAHTSEKTPLMKHTAEHTDDPEKYEPKQQLPYSKEIHQGDDVRTVVEETITQQKAKARNLGPNLTYPSIRRQESYPEWSPIPAHEQYRPEEQPDIPSSSQTADGTSRNPVIENLVTTQKAKRRNLGPGFTEHSNFMPTPYHEKKPVASSASNTATYAIDKSSQSQGSSQRNKESTGEKPKGYLGQSNGEILQLNRADPVQSRLSPGDVQSIKNILYNRTGTPKSKGVEASVDSSDDYVQASVDISDDFTQTDLAADTSLDTVIQMGDQNSGPSKISQDRSGKLKKELERLKNERIQILELLSLNYLPFSLTVELLEAKLNYCIGQTDLLLNSLDDTWDSERKPASSNQKPSNITREYLSKYKHDLRQSKKDIEMCKERIERRKGTGRGRPRDRNRDIYRMKRQAEIEAFKLERMREEHDYHRSKSSTPVRDQSPQVTPRQETPRSSSSGPISFRPRFMTPRQHKEHLINLRRQLVHLVESDVAQNRFSSPTCTFSQWLNRIISPHRADTSLSYSPKISVSISDLPGSQNMSTCAVPPQPSVGERSVSLDSIVRVTHGCRPMSTSPSMVHDSIANRGSCHVQSTSSLDRKTTAEGFYSPEESAQFLKEIEETKKRNRVEIESATEMLRRTSIDSGSHMPRMNTNTTHSPGYRTPQSQSFHGPPRSHSEYGTPRSQAEHQSARQLDSSTPRIRSECLTPRQPVGLVPPREVSPHSQSSGSSVSSVPRLLLSVDTSNATRQSSLDPGMYSPYSAYAREHLSQRQQYSGGILHGTYELYNTPSMQHTITPEEFPTLSGTTLEQSPSISRQDRTMWERLPRTRPITAYDVKTWLADKAPNG